MSAMNYIYVAVPKTKEKIKYSYSGKLSLIRDLKKFIAKETKVNIDDQLIFYRGKKLMSTKEDGSDSTLFDYKIDREDVVQLYPKATTSQLNANTITSSTLEKNVKENETSDLNVESQEVEDIESIFYANENDQIIFAGYTTCDVCKKLSDLPIGEDIRFRWSRIWPIHEPLSLELPNQDNEMQDSDEENNNSVTSDSIVNNNDLKTNENLVGVTFDTTLDNNKIIVGRVLKYCAKTELFRISYDEQQKIEVISRDRLNELVGKAFLHQEKRKTRKVKKRKIETRSVPKTKALVFEMGRPPSLSLDSYVLLHRDFKKKEFKVIPTTTISLPTENYIGFCLRHTTTFLNPGIYSIGLNCDPNQVECDECQDDESIEKCATCGCKVCFKKEETEVNPLILCDDCDGAYHIKCLKSRKHSAGMGILKTVPEDDWFCFDCFNDPSKITSGKLADKDKKKLNPADTAAKTWGGGMACVGRSTKNDIVGAWHYGKIPTVPVGSMWEYRIGISEDGVHRPPVAGISGRAKDGTYSIVLSGGYSDDEDEGEAFLYTGAGGRDLSGNKRVSGQSTDQELTRANAALAKNLNSKNWRKGKPIRVIRSSKLSKTSHGVYAPEIPEGWTQSFRYDGLYKVTDYAAVLGKSGHLVYRYLLRRDDDEPAPWTKEGKAIGPEYRVKGAGGVIRPINKRKVTQSTSDIEEEKKILDLIQKDISNEQKWTDILANRNPSLPLKDQADVLNEIIREFSCCICFEKPFQPITTKCGHNFCSSCFKRGISVKVREQFESQISCPFCRSRIDRSFAEKAPSNSQLIKALVSIVPSLAFSSA